MVWLAPNVCPPGVVRLPIKDGPGLVDAFVAVSKKYASFTTRVSLHHSSSAADRNPLLLCFPLRQQLLHAMLCCIFCNESDDQMKNLLGTFGAAAVLGKFWVVCSIQKSTPVYVVTGHLQRGDPPKASLSVKMRVNPDGTMNDAKLLSSDS